ncbi:MAG TPA: winged helix-turn-helix domain-containing protein [Acidimicrobiales bacterium]
MGDSANDATGRPVTPTELVREVIPDLPVLLAGPAEVWDGSGVRAWLDERGWAWTQAPDAERARWLASIQKVALVLVAGDERAIWSIVEATRPVTMAPLVVLAAPEPDEVVSLIGAGVDTVIDPSTGGEEMFARVTALLRRSDSGWEPGVRHLRAGSLRVDLWTQECDLDGEPLHFSPTEYALLTFLMTHPLQALSAHTIVRRVWGWFPSDGKNTLRIFVNRLRRKLGDDPKKPRFIASIRGTGYKFVMGVAALGDDTVVVGERVDVGSLLQLIEELAAALSRCHDITEAGEQMLELLEASGYADAMALFRVVSEHMELLSVRHMPKRWLQSVEGGVPLHPDFASAQTVLSGEPVQLSDIAQVSEQFAATFERLTGTGYRACLFLPIVRDGKMWGHLGLVRKARQPFDPVGTAYLRAAAGVFALATERFE